MDTLWMLEKAFPKVLIHHLSEPRPPYNTVLSVIRKLEREGHIGYNRYGKSHQYYPILQKDQYGRSLFRKLYDDVLDRSGTGLLSFFMKEENVNMEELQSLVNELKEQDDDNELCD